MSLEQKVQLLDLEEKSNTKGTTRHNVGGFITMVNHKILPLVTAFSLFLGGMYGRSIAKKIKAGILSPFYETMSIKGGDNKEGGEANFDHVGNIDNYFIENFSPFTQNEAYFFSIKEFFGDRDNTKRDKESLFYKLLTDEQKEVMLRLRDNVIFNGESGDDDYVFLVKIIEEKGNSDDPSDNENEKSDNKENIEKYYLGIKFNIPLGDPTGIIQMEKYGMFEINKEEADKIIGERLLRTEEWINNKFENLYKRCKGLDISSNEAYWLLRSDVKINYRGEEVPFIDYLAEVLSKEATWEGQHLDEELIKSGLLSLTDHCYDPDNHNLELNDKPFDVGVGSSKVHYDAMKLEKHYNPKDRTTGYRFCILKKDPLGVSHGYGTNKTLMIEFNVNSRTYYNLAMKFMEALRELYSKFGELIN